MITMCKLFLCIKHRVWDWEMLDAIIMEKREAVFGCATPKYSLWREETGYSGSRMLAILSQSIGDLATLDPTTGEISILVPGTVPYPSENHLSDKWELAGQGGGTSKEARGRCYRR